MVFRSYNNNWPRRRVCTLMMFVPIGMSLYPSVPTEKVCTHRNDSIRSLPHKYSPPLSPASCFVLTHSYKVSFTSSSRQYFSIFLSGALYFTPPYLPWPLFLIFYRYAGTELVHSYLPTPQSRQNSSSITSVPTIQCTFSLRLACCSAHPHALFLHLSTLLIA